IRDLSRSFAANPSPDLAFACPGPAVDLRQSVAILFQFWQFRRLWQFWQSSPCLPVQFATFFQAALTFVKFFSAHSFPLDTSYLGIDNLDVGFLWLRMKCFPELWACWSCGCCSPAPCTDTPLPSASTSFPTTCCRWKKARSIPHSSACC